MELQQILSKMEADGWEIADDFKKVHGHFLQYFLETVEEALRHHFACDAFCGNCGKGEPMYCAECYKIADESYPG